MNSIRHNLVVEKILKEKKMFQRLIIKSIMLTFLSFVISMFAKLSTTAYTDIKKHVIWTKQENQSRYLHSEMKKNQSEEDDDDDEIYDDDDDDNDDEKYNKKSSINNMLLPGQEASTKENTEKKKSDAKELTTKKALQLLKEAKNEFAFGNNTKSIELCKQAITLAPDVRETYNQLALIYIRLNDYTAATQQLKTFLSKAEEHNSITDKSAANINLAAVYYKNGKYTRAKEHAHEGYQLSYAIGDMEKQAESLSWIGNVHAATGDYKQALTEHKRALKINKEIRSETGLAYTYNNIGLVMMQQGEYDEALEYYKKSLNLNDKLKLYDEVAKNYNNAAYVYQVRGEYEHALKWYKESAQRYEEIGDEISASIPKIYMGKIHLERGDLEQAKALFESAQKPLTDFKQQDNMITLEYHWGEYYRIQGNYTQALQHYRRGESYAKALGQKDRASDSENYEGMILLQQGKNEEARTLFERSLTLYESTSRIEKADRYTNIGIVLYRQGKHTKALEYYTQALEIYEHLEAQPRIATCHSNISLVYFKRGDYAEALQELDKAYKIDKALHLKTGLLNDYMHYTLYYTKAQNRTQAAQMHKEAEKLSKALQLKPKLALFEYTEGTIQHTNALYDQSLASYKSSEALYQDLGDAYSLALLHNNTGILHAQKNDLEQAEKSLTQALEITRAQSYTEEHQRIQQNLAKLYTQHKEYTKALILYEQITSTLQSSTHKQQAFALHRDRAFIYKQQNENEQALESYKAAIKLYEALHTQGIEVSLNYIQTAQFFEEQGDIEHALKLYFWAYSHQTQAKLTERLYACSQLVRLYLKQENYPQAEEYQTEKLRLAKTHRASNLKAIEGQLQRIQKLNKHMHT